MKKCMKGMAFLLSALLMISLMGLTVFAENTDAAGSTAKKLSTPQIVGIVLMGVIIVAAVVLGIIFREKVKKFLVVYKSEVKKIVWLSWKQTLKSSWAVIVVMVACALAICLLDFALSKGLLAFIGLFN